MDPSEDTPSEDRPLPEDTTLSYLLMSLLFYIYND
jgi:hypothetical protein